MKFKTETGSEYEVNTDSKKIRRMTGVKEATARQGKDGEWKGYVDLVLSVGTSAMIYWDASTHALLPSSFGGELPTTITSKVISIEY